MYAKIHCTQSPRRSRRRGPRSGRGPRRGSCPASGGSPHAGPARRMSGFWIRQVPLLNNGQFCNMYEFSKSETVFWNSQFHLVWFVPCFKANPKSN